MLTEWRNYKFLQKKNVIILGIVLLIGIVLVQSTLSKEVIIRDGDKQIVVKTISSDVMNVLKKGNINLGEHDQVSPKIGTKVKDRMVISVERAHPVTLTVDGQTKEILTANLQVEDILKEYDIALGKLDRIEPELNTTVKAGEVITVVRVESKYVSEKTRIPYQSITKFNEKMEKGVVNLIQKGSDGEKEVKYEILYEDGIEVSKTPVEEKILVEPVNEIAEKGTAQYVATSRGTMRVKQVIVMTATAYDASYESTGKRPGDKYYGITRSGTKVRPGVVAVDPKVIPLGTKLYIESMDKWPDYGFASAEDTGGAIKGNKIDLFYEDSNTVDKFGRRKVKVYILE
ncbi:MAG: 3D domain-containing protein [Bacillota bacterium]